MREFLKRNWAVVLAFLLPVFLIIGVAISTYLPSLFISTQYNFLYAVCTDSTNYYRYNCNYNLLSPYKVADGRLVVEEKVMDPEQDLNYNSVPDVKENYTVRIMLHDTEKNESREISLEEAKKLSLDGLLTSPDGVTVSSHYERGGDLFLIFDGNSDYGYYLTKGRSRSRLNLINQDDYDYYRDNFQFIGWVLPARN